MPKRLEAGEGLVFCDVFSCILMRDTTCYLSLFYSSLDLGQELITGSYLLEQAFQQSLRIHKNTLNIINE